MFKIRQTGLVTDEKIKRQTIVKNVIFYETNKLDTSLEKIAAAISPFGHKAINPIIQSKVFSIVQYLWKEVMNKNTESFNDQNILKEIKDLVFKQPLVFNTTITLPQLLPTFVSYTINENVDIQVSCDVKTESRVNIIDFEKKVFKNKVKFRYLSKDDFGTYLFQNILYYLNASSLHDLEGNDQWQAKLARLLREINFDSHLARLAFMKTDEIIFRDNGKLKKYYTGFVPYYNVYDLKTVHTLDLTCCNDEYIDYYNNFDVRKDIIPENKRSIFRVFPFKDGYYIMPCGKKIYLNFNKCKNKRTFNILFNNLCSIYDIESAMEDITMNMKYVDDVINKAVNSITLKEQAIALLLLRKMVGPILVIEDYEIKLPNEYTVLSWTTSRECFNFEIYSPKKYVPICENTIECSHKYDIYINLIADIAKSCFDKMGAAILCSRYIIPTYLSGNIFDVIRTKNDEGQTYIFLTFMLQQYTTIAYSIARNTLQPKFGKQEIDLDKKYKRHYKRYIDKTFSDKIDAHSITLITLSKNNLCSSYNCPDLYVFTDAQLAELVELDHVTLTYEQLANLITLYISPVSE